MYLAKYVSQTKKNRLFKQKVFSYMAKNKTKRKTRQSFKL